MHLNGHIQSNQIEINDKRDENDWMADKRDSTFNDRNPREYSCSSCRTALTTRSRKRSCVALAVSRITVLFKCFWCVFQIDFFNCCCRLLCRSFVLFTSFQRMCVWMWKSLLMFAYFIAASSFMSCLQRLHEQVNRFFDGLRVNIQFSHSRHARYFIYHGKYTVNMYRVPRAEHIQLKHYIFSPCAQSVVYYMILCINNIVPITNRERRGGAMQAGDSL